MYARVTRIRVKTDKIDEASRITESELTPALEKDPGFRGAFVLGDRETGESLAITMWDSLEAEEASRAMVAERLGMLSELFEGPPETPQTFEVILASMPATTPAA